MIVAKYSDFKDEDDEWQSSEDDNSDYHAQVLDEYETD